MDAVIHMHLSEITEKSISQLKDIIRKISGKTDPELTISVSSDSANEEYREKLNTSIKEYQEGNYVSFTMESLEKYIRG